MATDANWADELMEDLNDLSGGEDEPQEVEERTTVAPAGLDKGKRKREDGDEDMNGEEADEELLPVPEGGTRPADELKAEDVEETDLTSVDDPGNVAKLWGSKQFQGILQVSFPPWEWVFASWEKSLLTLTEA
jgi:U4/U6 small nuclear ribonucleoprotein PRP31